MMTPLEFVRKVNKLDPGGRLLYYTGYLVSDGRRAVRLLREQTQALLEEEVVLLATKRVGPNTFEYYAIKTRQGKVTPRMVFFAEQREKQL